MRTRVHGGGLEGGRSAKGGVDNGRGMFNHGREAKVGGDESREQRRAKSGEFTRVRSQQ